MPIDQTRLNALLDDDTGQRARESALGAPKVSPDDMGRALGHAQRMDKPPLAVADDLAHFDELAHLDAVSEAGRDNPKLGDWLADPARAALAKDDLPVLSKLAQGLAGMRKFAAGNPALWPAIPLIDATKPEIAQNLGKRFQVADVAMVADVQRYAGDLGDRFANAGPRALSGIFRAGGNDQAADALSDPLGFRDIAAQGAAVGREARADQQVLGQEFKRGEVPYYLGMGADSLPAMLGAVATRRAELAAGVVGLTTQATGVAQAQDEGLSFATANEKTLLTQTLPEVGGSLLTFGKIFGQGSLLRRMWTAAATEGGGEGVTTLAQETGDAAYDGRRVDPMDLFLKTVDSVIVGGLMGGSMATLGKNEVEARDNAEHLSRLSRSARSSRDLAAITASAAESKTVQRAPGEIEALVGDDAGMVYVPAETVRTLYQEDDIDTFVAGVTGDANALTLAGESGDIAIPMAKWASTIARLPNAPEWARHGRTDSDGHSAADLESADAWEPQVDGSVEPTDTDGVAAVEKDLYGQLVASGRYRDTEAATQAKLVARTLGTMAESQGVDVGTLYESYALKVNAGPTQQGKPNLLDLDTNAMFDAVRNGTIPSERDVMGAPLLSFLAKIGGVQDSGGELVGRDAVKQRPGLVNGAGMPLDMAREAAVEAGYLPEGADINTLLDAIDTELRGEMVFSDKNADAGLRQFRDAAIDLERDVGDAYRDMDPEAFGKLSNQDLADGLADKRVRERQMGTRGLFGRMADKVVELYQSATGKGEDASALPKDAWTKLAELYMEIDPEAFQFGFSAAKDLNGILDDMLPGAKAGEWGPAAPDLRASGIQGVLNITMPDGSTARLDMHPGGKFSLDASGLKSGQSFGGALYQAAADYAMKNGFVFIGDPMGLSDVAVYRRTEQMLSSALRAGTTRHLAPHPRQMQPDNPDLGDDMPDVQPLRWETGNDRANIAALLETAYRNVEKVIPEIKDFRYNFANGKFEPIRAETSATDGGIRSPDREGSGGVRPAEGASSAAGESAFDWRAVFSRIAGEGQAERGIGSATIARAVLAQTLLQGNGQAIRPGMVAAHESGADNPLTNLLGTDAANTFYQDPAAGGVSASGALNQTGPRSAPRGALKINGRQMTIDLGPKADLSTLLHEFGHFFLEVMGDLAQRAEATPRLAADFDTVLQWGKIPGDTPEARRAAWLAMDIDARRHLHEGFAEGFEQYLQEGKAPAPELVSMFATFRAWLTGVYRSLRQSRIPLSDDVRGVMDRMIATDEEIEAVKARQFTPALDEAAAMAAGIDPARYAEVKARLEAASEEARAKLNAELLRAMQREHKAWWKTERAAVLADVEAEYEAAPAVRAWRVLSGRKIEGLPESLQGLKLSSDAVKDTMPDGRVPAEILSLKVFGKDGVSPDEAASLLGFSSGAELLLGLRGARDALARVETEADNRMRDRHGDPMLDGSLPVRAQAASHQGARVRALEAELAMLEELAADPTATPSKAAGESKPRGPMAPEQRAKLVAAARARAQVGRAFRVIAQRRVAGLRVRDLRPNDHLVAERKAARKAAEAAGKGDWIVATAAKREQILHGALYRAARDAQVLAGKAQTYLKRFTTKKVRAKLGKAGADYLAQIDGLLERFDLRQVGNAASDRRARLADWIAEQHAAGIPVTIDEALVDEAFSVPFRELTVGQADALRDAVTNLAHLAALKNKLLLKGEHRDRAAIDKAMAESLLAGNKERANVPGLASRRDNAHAGMMRFRAIQGSATDLARELDGFKEGGAVWEHTVGVIRDAVNNLLNPALRKAQEAMAGIYLKHYSKAELRNMRTRRVTADGTWSHESLLALALNWGNAGNREAILSQRRGRLTEAQAARLLGTLTARDWAFVADAWALVDTHWPDIARVTQERTGLAPAKVVPEPFTITTADGQTITLPGGYYPLKYAADSMKSMKDEAEDIWNALRIGRTAKAATRNGHTIERVGSGGRTVKLELSVLEGHLRDTLRDIHLGDAINYVHNALNGGAFGEAVSDTGMLDVRKALEFWLKDVATGEMTDHTAGAKAARFLRTNFTAAVLTYRVTSAALQITGLSASLAVLGPRIAQGVQRVMRYPKQSYNYVRDASPMMAARMDGFVEAITEVNDARAGRFASGRAAMMRYGFWMMGKVQSIVDVSTWIAAEAQGMELFGNDAGKARAYADDVVTRAQGSQEFMDKTPLGRGSVGDTTRQSEWIRALSALSSYMLAKGNLLYEKTRKTNFRDPAQAFTWGGHMVLLLVVEQIVAAAIRGQLPSDEDDDGWADDWAKWLATETTLGALGTVPFLNSISGNLRGYGSGGIINGFADALSGVAKQLWPDEDGDVELDKAALKATVKAVGYGTGIPSSQINKTIDTIAAERDGQDVTLMQYVNGQPPK